MISYNKDDIKEKVTIDEVFQLLTEWGGEPKFTSFGIISATICHNEPGVGSHKLYFYENSNLFKCYTGCDDSYFDIFELVIKVTKIQQNKEFDLNEAVRWIAQKLNISGEYVEKEEELLQDWKYLNNYDRIQNIELKENPNILLKEYDNEILNRFNYSLKIKPWLEEDISQSVLDYAKIGFYPGGDQITIPHFDKDGRFIGLRGRTLCQEEGERFGKYRPLKINKQLYNHPLGMNLYNYNHAKNNINILQKAIVFEGEKSVLKYQSYFGLDNDIAVACCGSSLSNYQMQLLIEAGAKEIIIAFDRQFQEIGDSEFKRLKANLLKIREKYKNEVNISFIFDKTMITDYKSSPIDHGPEIFLQLFKNRIFL